MVSSVTSGFSLIEVLVSLFLLSFVLLGLLTLHFSVWEANRQNTWAFLAMEQLQNIEERLRYGGSNVEVETQLEAWNEENKALLPQGRGVLQGAYPVYDVELCWELSQAMSQPVVGSKGHCLRESVFL